MILTARLITLLIIPLLLFGCSTAGVGGGSPAAVIVTKKPDTTSSDCSISIGLFNRMQSEWAGVSYWFVIRDANNRPRAEFRGIPMRYTEPGYGIVVQDKAQGVRCEHLVSVSILYFGYYPVSGAGQVRIRNSGVIAKIK